VQPCAQHAHCHFLEPAALLACRDNGEIETIGLLKRLARGVAVEHGMDIVKELIRLLVHIAAMRIRNGMLGRVPARTRQIEAADESSLSSIITLFW
jgi:hypothetical protein